MTITIGVWVIPTIMTACVWIWCCGEVRKGTGGHLDMTGFFEFIGSIIGTLFIWLVYFAIMYFSRI